MTPPDARLVEIAATFQAIQTGWPFLLGEINARIGELTAKLIDHESEQTRGGLKELMRLRDMPETLLQEADGIRAGLAESAPANEA